MKIKDIEQFSDFLIRVTEDEIPFNREDPKTTIDVRTVTFQVTDACNLACSYCYQINKHTNRMSFETAKKFIDLLFEDYKREGSYVYNARGVILEFIGGEPLLEIELIEQICDYFYYKAITEKHRWAINSKISMISNGVLYFDERVQKFLRKYKNIISFDISVDGCKELHDACRVFPDGKPSYDLAAAACLYHKKYFNKEMSTKMTIAPANVNYLYKAIVNLIENLHYDVIHCNCVYEEGWEPEHAVELYKQLKMVADYIIEHDLEEKLYVKMFDNGLFDKTNLEVDDKNYCGSTGCMLACDPFGKIFPCIRFMETSLGNSVEPWILGDVDNGIGILPKHKEKINILDSITFTSQSPQKCIDCPISAGCGWCTGYNYQVTGTPNKRLTYTCEMHKATALANVYYWNKCYIKHDEDERFEMRVPKEWALNIISEDEYNMLCDLAKK